MRDTLYMAECSREQVSGVLKNRRRIDERSGWVQVGMDTITGGLTSFMGGKVSSFGVSLVIGKQ